MTPDAALRERIAKLEEQLAQARETIAYLEADHARDDDEADLRWLWLGVAMRIQPKALATLRVLYEARSIVTLPVLEDSVWPEGPVPFKAVNIYICKLRKILGFEAIENLWGRGYRLTDVGRALVRQRLAALQMDAA